MAQTKSPAERGTCPECGQTVPLYRGKLRSHQVRATVLQPAATCHGGTRPPGTYNAPGQLTLGVS